MSSSVKWAQRWGDSVMLAWDDEMHTESILFHSQETDARKAQHLTAGWFRDSNPGCLTPGHFPCRQSNTPTQRPGLDTAERNFMFQQTTIAHTCGLSNSGPLHCHGAIFHLLVILFKVSPISKLDWICHLARILSPSAFQLSSRPPTWLHGELQPDRPGPDRGSRVAVADLASKI